MVAERGGAEESFTASVVIVSSGAVNSAALPLRSADARHPDGLANGSGVVGRHDMAHNTSAMVALSKRPNTTKFQKTLGVNDEYYGGGSFEFSMGHVQMLGKSQPDMFRGDAKFAPGYVLERMATHALDDVVDGSFFVSSTAVNPALTIIANALRVAEVITARFAARPATAAKA